MGCVDIKSDGGTTGKTEGKEGRRKEGREEGRNQRGKEENKGGRQEVSN